MFSDSDFALLLILIVVIGVPTWAAIELTLWIISHVQIIWAAG